MILAAALPPGPVGYVPTGSLADLHDLGHLARLRAPGVRALVVDTPGEVEPGRTVLADVAGPGILQWIWLAPAAEDPGKGRVLIGLDGRDEPVLDLPWDDLFHGRHPRFPRPLVGQGPGGRFCLVPIAFRAGCRVVAVGGAPPAYQIGVTTLPGTSGVSSFTAAVPAAERPHLARARALWGHPDGFDARSLPGAETASFPVDVLGQATLTFALPAGPRTIRALEVSPAEPDAWRRARLLLIWDGDDPRRAGVDLPVGLAFGPVPGADPAGSVLVGRTGRLWSNRFPMPYRRGGRLQVRTTGPIRGTIRVVTVPGVAADAGYFRAQLRQARRATPQPADGSPWLSERGRGHYVGTLLWGRSLAAPGGAIGLAVDGRPALRSTPIEAAFLGGSAWLGRPASTTAHDPLVVGPEDEPRVVAASRWHLADPIPFERSLVAGPTSDARATGWTDPGAAIFWYSERPGPTWARPGPEVR